MARYGVRFENDPSLTPADYQELARRAEDRGYEMVWVPEGAGRDSLTGLATIAMRTERIKLGTGILPIFARTPVNTAMGAAGIAEISGGRFILGLGVGHRPTVESRDGVPFRQPMTRLRETIQIARALLAGEEVNFAGKHFNLSGATLGSDGPQGQGTHLHRSVGTSDAGDGRRVGRRRPDELDCRQFYSRGHRPHQTGRRQSRKGHL